MSACFLLSFIVSALLCVALFIWLCISLHVNWSRRNKIGFSYLLPVLLSVLFIGGIIFEFRPRLQDMFHIVSENIISLTLESGSYAVENDRLIYNENTYKLAPEHRNLDPAMSYRLTVAPLTHFVLTVEQVMEVEDQAISDTELTKP